MSSNNSSYSFSVSFYFYSLNFDKIKRSDTAIYSCKSTTDEWSNITLSVINDSDHRYSSEVDKLILAKLTEIRDKKKIRSKNGQPKFKNMNLMPLVITKTFGESVKFNCVSEGDPIPTISWTKDGKQLKRNKGPTFIENWYLDMEELNVDDNGAYTCHVCNIYSCINFTTILEVTPLKIFEKFVEDHDILSQIMECDTDDCQLKDEEDNDEDDNYFENTQTSNLEENNSADENYDETDQSANNKTTDYDDYVVDETDQSNNTTTDQNEEFFLEFKKELPNYIGKPSGNMINLICRARGNPPPTSIEWTKNGLNITRHMGNVIYRKWSLVLEDLVPSDDGVYMCKVCNKITCITARTMVRVQGKQNFKLNFSNKILIN